MRILYCWWLLGSVGLLIEIFGVGLNEDRKAKAIELGPLVTFGILMLVTLAGPIELAMACNAWYCKTRD